MQTKLLEYLICPECYTGKLNLINAQQEETEIISGNLECTNCQKHYTIIRGIPRFITIEIISADKRKTSTAFGWEWRTFSHLHGIEYYKQQFLDWIDPIQPNFFINKLILDAGCGMGRFAQVAGLFGAKDVLAIDLSDAVEAAYNNTRHLHNVHIIQADIYKLPIKKSQLDFAYSIGVLHHLPNPEAGFHSIIQHIKPGGAIFAWIYGYENNQWIIRFINPMREKIFSRLPKSILYGMSWLFTLLFHPIIKLLYSHTKNKQLPYKAYLTWLAQYSFHHTHHVVFDHLVAPTAFYIKREDFAAWFVRANIKETIISWRNQNSWRGFGKIS